MPTLSENMAYTERIKDGLDDYDVLSGMNRLEIVSAMVSSTLAGDEIDAHIAAIFAKGLAEQVEAIRKVATHSEKTANQEVDSL